MTPLFNKIHLKFRLNGINYDREGLKEVAYSLVKEGESYERVTGNFLLDWLDDKDFVLVKTSGSTGVQKTIKLKKQAMVNSAIMTGDFFKLKPGDTALHCLPSQYIAGKMMLVRAMILGLELDMVAPSSMPAYQHLKPYDFCAMIPLQLKKSLGQLMQIKTLIVGGASVSNSLKEELKGLDTRVFETYGMTETVSHIAVRCLNFTSEKGAHFQILKDIKIHADNRGCLVIEAKQLTDDIITTNDVVDVVSKSEFDIIGRFDNMINSGGVKLFPELIEAKLSDNIKSRFFITSEPDKDLGQKVVLVLEGDSKTFNKDVFGGLSKFEIPKKVYHTTKFIETETGKLQRQKTFKSIIK
ncbi:AMP-binding protein [uncultured Psychroserpens sp.]|uniref:AMP-binding protein n=1 Tax=uncultured Psychroserpens sp. TaxID=255436 RepID=UPI00262000B4|nr:AMP-binding protein [uncultured Psychroserpens sp.]